MQQRYDITIIGSGIIGSMLAYKLSHYSLRIALIERASDLCEGISKANSGVLHAGFNVPTGTLKAKFNVAGLKLYPKILKELKIPYKKCKKLVIALDDSQKEELVRLLKQGKANGCKRLKIINQRQILKINPKLKGKWALYSPMTSVVAPYQLSTILAENAALNGVDILLKSEVTAIDNDLTIEINNQEKIKSEHIINCAGIAATDVANLLEKTPYKTYPCKGEYYVLDKHAGEVLNVAVYPVPLKDGRSLGVHLTPTPNGNILIGPSAEYQEERSDLSNSLETMEKLKEEAYKLLPDLKNYSLIKNYAGLRPKLKENGFSDFVIEAAQANSKMLNLLGIESPGLTAAPAIADHIIEDFLKLTKTEKKKPTHFPTISPRSLPLKKRQKLVTKNPKFGEIICRCEEITHKEIENALNNPAGSKTINSIKKRTHATMGRCQGGFCLSKITTMLSQDIHPSEIRKGEGKMYERYRHEKN